MGSSERASQFEKVWGPLHARVLRLAWGRGVLFSAASALIILLSSVGGQAFAWNESSWLALIVLGAAIASSVCFTWLTRRRELGDGWLLSQLIVDQFLITVLVYLSGAASSGATALYGLIGLAAGYLLGARAV
ncbi:MAG: hypothetical protein MK135_10920, partial [Polyangiaceae bacterium]|nr:hypothetical protein [Polyangiaceae bacterium]